MHQRIYGEAEIKQDGKQKVREEEEKIYEVNRKQYLADHPICEVRGCNNKAVEIHHKMGKIGKLIYNILYFLGVCRKCHKKIEANPQWAKQEGYSVSRLSKK